MIGAGTPPGAVKLHCRDGYFNAEAASKDFAAKKGLCHTIRISGGSFTL